MTNSVFTAKQSAEKYLKALMEELGLAIPHTHNLVALLPLLTVHHGSLRSLWRGLDFLTRFAVATRYPGDSASKRQAAASLRWTKRVRSALAACCSASRRGGGDARSRRDCAGNEKGSRLSVMAGMHRYG